MARKKKSNIKGISFIGAGVAVAVAVVAVFVLYPNILEQNIITTTTDEELIQDGIDAGLLKVPIPCFEITDCMEGQPIIEDPVDTNPINEIIDPTPVNATDVEPELVCDPPAEKINEQCVLPEPPLPEQPTVEIISNVTKIANNGERFTSSTSLDIPLASLFVDDTTNIDFDQGFIENELFLKTNPNSNIELNGFFDIKIDNKTILSNAVPINIQGISDQDGLILINFISPTGIASDTFLFSFNNHLDKFPVQGLTNVEYNLSSLNANIDGFSYELDFGIIYEMDIFTDPNLLIITDEQGGTTRVFPSDDRVRLCSSAGQYCYGVCVQHSVTFGCQKSKTVCYPVSAQPVGAWAFFKQDKLTEVFVAQDSGIGFTNSCPLDVMVERDAVYKLQINNPEAGTIIWKTPETQRNFLFSCTSASADFITITNNCNYKSQAFLDTLESP